MLEMLKQHVHGAFTLVSPDICFCILYFSFYFFTFVWIAAELELFMTCAKGTVYNYKRILLSDVVFGHDVTVFMSME